MGKINWGRVVLCGIVAGLAWTVLSSIITAFVARDFVAAVPGGRLSAPSGGLIAFLFIVSLVMGIWAMWLYAAIRPRYGPGPKTAVVTGFSWWVISSLIDATWGSFGFVVPKAVLAPMAASLPAIIIAAVVGGVVLSGVKRNFPLRRLAKSRFQLNADRRLQRTATCNLEGF